MVSGDAASKLERYVLKAVTWSLFDLRETNLDRWPILIFSLSLIKCMDVERNPGPTSTLTNSRHFHLLDPPPTQFCSSNLFNTTKRIQLKFTWYNHHHLNYSFFKENNYIPPSLYARKFPLHSDNQFNRKWKHISHQAAHKHLKLLIEECKNKINTLNMELLRKSYSSEFFSLYASKLTSMALSLESLLKIKKDARRKLHGLSTVSFNTEPPTTLSGTASNATTSNVTVNLSMPNVLTQHSLTDNNTTPINIITLHLTFINYQ